MKKALALILALVMVFALCACGTAAETPAAPETPAETETPTDGELPWAGHTLYVANWQGYNSDEDYCEKAFEDMTGAQVEHVYFNSYDELMTTLMTGGNKTIDAVVLSNNYTQWFHDEGLLANVDPAKIPNYAEVADVYKDLSPYAVDDAGNLFAFPWCNGTSSLAYNPDKVDFELEHWSDLLNPALKGHVMVLDGDGDDWVIGCLLAGVFEEVGRYLAFRFLLKRYTNRRDAVTYGIGHGGIEAILVLGLTAINNIAIAQLVNSGSIETITNGLTGVQLDQVQAQIAAVASFGAANLLLGLAERAIAMTLHISLSVVVFRAVRQRKAGYLGLAVALHALFDVPAALFQCGVLHSTWLVEALLLVLCLGCAAYAKKQYCALQEPEQQTLSDKEES